MDFYEAKALDVLSSQGERPEDGGFVFESRRGRSSNTKPSNINKNNLVAPTGFDHDTSAFELEFEGLALVLLC